MSGYVDVGRNGCTELRVHGVSGTSPDSTLGHPTVRQVAGDRTAGFFRRWWPARSVSADDRTGRQEAYSWGGLTVATGRRALWLLLLPYLLANVAFFMLPYAPTHPSRPRTALRGVSESAQRLIALSLTFTFVLSVVSVSMDLLTWQCSRSDTDCGSVPGWATWLTRIDFLDQPSRRLALAACVPVATVGLLWWLARVTWASYERFIPPQRIDAAAEQQQLPLEQRRLWNGADAVAQLRALHIAGGFALVGALLLAPTLSDRDRTEGIPRAVLMVLLVCCLAVLVVSATLSLLPQPAQRHEPGQPARHRADNNPIKDTPLEPAADTFAAAVRWAGRGVRRWLPIASLVLVASAILASLLPDIGPATTDGVAGQPAETMPWLIWSMNRLLSVQLLLWLVVLGATALLAVASRRDQRETAERLESGAADTAAAPGKVPGPYPSSARAWFGLGTPAFLLLAWLVAVDLSAGLTLQIADYLGRPVAPDAPAVDDAIVLPHLYFWLSAAAFWTAVGLVVSVLVALVLVRWRQRRLAPEVAKAYGTPTDEETRSRQSVIARAWSAATIPDVGRKVLGVFLILLAVAVPVMIVLYVLNGGHWLSTNSPSWAITGGSRLLCLAILAMLLLARRTYKNPVLGRNIGILWDLSTFWPRATHPLAPPCYCERALPDLIVRTRHLTAQPADVVVLSGHSQGSVILAALVLQLDPETQRRVCLLTYGSPLRRLYSRFFPGYFGVQSLVRLGQVLGDGDGCDPEHRARWAWRNLHRPSDPIGGPVLQDHPLDQTGSDRGDVDRPIVDPKLSRAAGDTSYPTTYGHSNYFADPAFADSLDVVRGLRSTAACDATADVPPTVPLADRPATGVGPVPPALVGIDAGSAPAGDTASGDGAPGR